MKNLCFILISFMLFSACSSTTWIVENEEAVDRGDYKLLDSDFFLEKTGATTPESPVARFVIKSANTFEYTKRIKSDRYIQRYRPRLGYVALGVAASGLSAYSALEFTDDDKQGQQIALFGASAALLGVSFLNMKAVGEPTPTGETRLLRKTGTYVDSDTLDAPATISNNLSYSIAYSGQVLINDKTLPVSGNSFSINFLEDIDPDIFSDFNEDPMVLNVSFQDSVYNYEIPVQSVFEPFIVVTSTVTALRNNPEQNSNNALTDLAQGSQLKLVEQNGEWFKVLYGISENWVSANDVETIWRPSQFSDQLSVVAIPNVPFGSVDVERSIPRLSDENPDKFGFIIANQNYEGNLPNKAYAQRDAQLVEKYMTDALGFPESQVLKNLDISGSRTALNAFNRLSSQISNQEQKDLTVYLNGYAKVDAASDRIYMLGTSNDSSASLINLNDLFDGFANLPVSKLTVIADLDFSDQESSDQVLQILSAVVTTQVANSVVLFSSEPGQRSYTYAEPNGLQKRHSIFTYFFADALKNRNTRWEDIRSHIERNVSFTSRSIFNSAQDILFFGNDSLDISE